ncbi:MAG: right-handed parallel beta-helix repeat-containing protein [Acidobacteria bacterium]|jgi:parallel beta-helix repeat protein|nr:right-handed parallel beta-helix repeat-containing protein [Acidobacteriota bacterium]
MNYMKFRKNILFVLGMMMFVVMGTINTFANHPVFVEGNCLGDGSAARTLVPPGTCGDYDGDGRIGTAEDTDAPFDRVFGTINAANSATGINNNGTITIVASGIFPETVSLLGNVTLQAAPGVEANIDAVLQGDPGGTARQGQPGIIVNSGSLGHTQVIRNITSKNWTSGIRVMGQSRVAIENCRLENNVNYGIEILGNARVTISDTKVRGTGYRISPVGSFPFSNAPNPGIGIEFDGNSSGTVFSTSVSQSFRAGISDVSTGSVCVALINVFDNSPNLVGIVPSATSCN